MLSSSMRFFAALAAGFFFATASVAAFPVLTGRVVDGAHVLPADTQRLLESQLAEYEKQTSNQLVVVTVPSLGGQPIEQYGYQLGRSWGIGQKEKNNGVLLIVAPKEHRVRIEVGYGLEGVLTDAASSQIIQSVILPQFKQGRLDKGITDGVDAIEKTIGGEFTADANTDSTSQIPAEMNDFIGYYLMAQFAGFALVFVATILVGIGGMVNGSSAGDAKQRLVAALPGGLLRLVLWLLFPLALIALFSHNVAYAGYGGGYGRSSRDDDEDSGGGFSGGGGSFGGGGSSGSW